MKKQDNMWSAFTFLVIALMASPGHAVTVPNSVNTVETVVLASALTSNAIAPSNNVDLSSVTGASNLYWVFGGSLIGLSLVTRRLSV